MDRLPERYQSLIAPLIEHSRQLLKDGHELAPIAFVGSSQRGEVRPLLLNTKDGNTKQGSAAMVRALAHEMPADFVFTIMEVFALEGDRETYQRAIARYGSLSKCPDAREVVMFYFETPEGIWNARTSIGPKSATGARELTEDVVFELSPGVSGAMTGFLPALKPDGGAPTLQ
jgi:hypothetical protein